MSSERQLQDSVEIGGRVRAIRTRRGLTVAEAAGLAGITTGYLSLLENGRRRFARRGLLEDLANALGCSVIDLTGQPFPPADREIAEGKHVIALIEAGLNDATLDDVPDLRPRPLSELRHAVYGTARLRDEGQYGAAAEDTDHLMIDLQIHAATSSGDQRREAAELLTYSAYNAFVVATTYGYLHLAQHAAQRAYDAAIVSENPELIAFSMFARAPSIARNGGRARGERMIERAISDAQSLTATHGDSTTGAEAVGLLNLMRAHFAARDNDADTARSHLNEAIGIAEHTGERNGFGQHFGPTNVGLWEVSIGAELGEGPDVAERAKQKLIDGAILHSRDRTAALHFDMARAYAQAEGTRDQEALRHLDTADRMAPQRIRQDPIARDLLRGFVQRARRRTWELDSMRNRFGLR